MTPAEIKSLRHRLGWTQSKLAEWCGVTVRAVKFWEQGKYEPSPPVRKLLGILLERPAIERKTGKAHE